jgi:anti-sigma regulatory factor (Ser/Thr protein kinase)
MPDVELRLPPDVQFVGLARLVVCAAARHAGMSDERVEDLRIAVSEAIANAINAHTSVGRTEPIELSFGAAADGSFAVTVSDTGFGFEPISPQQAADRDWTDESGLGVTIIRNLADDVRFLRGEGMQVSIRFAVGLRADGF